MRLHKILQGKFLPQIHRFGSKGFLVNCQLRARLWRCGRSNASTGMTRRWPKKRISSCRRVLCQIRNEGEQAGKQRVTFCERWGRQVSDAFILKHPNNACWGLNCKRVILTSPSRWQKQRRTGKVYTLIYVLEHTFSSCHLKTCPLSCRCEWEPLKESLKQEWAHKYN